MLNVDTSEIPGKMRVDLMPGQLRLLLSPRRCRKCAGTGWSFTWLDVMLVFPALLGNRGKMCKACRGDGLSPKIDTPDA